VCVCVWVRAWVCVCVCVRACVGLCGSMLTRVLPPRVCYVGVGRVGVAMVVRCVGVEFWVWVWVSVTFG
jgi:hypothetical protein